MCHKCATRAYRSSARTSWSGTDQRKRADNHRPTYLDRRNRLPKQARSRRRDVPLRLITLASRSPSWPLAQLGGKPCRWSRQCSGRLSARDRQVAALADALGGTPARWFRDHASGAAPTVPPWPPRWPRQGRRHRCRRVDGPSDRGMMDLDRLVSRLTAQGWASAPPSPQHTLPAARSGRCAQTVCASLAGGFGSHPFEHREMVVDHPVGGEPAHGVGSAGTSI